MFLIVRHEQKRYFTLEPYHAVVNLCRLVAVAVLEGRPCPEKELVVDRGPPVMLGNGFMTAVTGSFLAHHFVPQFLQVGLRFAP